MNFGFTISCIIEPGIILSIVFILTVSFHTYKHEVLTILAERYKPVGRPIICTEHMARMFNCFFDTMLTLFKTERVGAISWESVDGTPYDAHETKFIRQNNPYLKLK